MDRDIQERVIKAIQAGANPQEAQRRGAMLQQSRQNNSSVLSGNLSSPNLVKNNGVVGNIVNAVARPFVQTGQTIGGSAFEAARAIKANQGQTDAYAMQNGQAKYKNPFLSQQQVENPTQVLGNQVKNSAAIASYGIPVGGSTSLFGKGISAGAFKGGALAGGLQSLSGDDVTPESVLTGAALGGAVGKGLEVAGKAFNSLRGSGKTVEDIGTKVRGFGGTDITLKPSVYGAGREAQVQSTLDELGIFGTTKQRYSKLEGAMSDLGSEIKKIIRGRPQEIETSEVAQEFLKNLQSDIRSKSISSKSAQSEVKGYLEDLMKISKKEVRTSAGTGMTTGKELTKGAGSELMIPENPLTMSSEHLDELRKLVNKDYKGIRTKIARGNIPLNDREKVIAAGKQALDDVLGRYYPDAQKMIWQQADLFDAAPSLGSGRKNPPTLRAAGFSIPKGATEYGANVVGSSIEKVGKATQLWPGIKMPSVARQALPRLASVLQNIQAAPQQSQKTTPSDGVVQSRKQPANQITPEVVAAAYYVLPKAKADIIKAIYDMQSKAGGGKQLTEKQAMYQSAAEGATYALNLLDNGEATTGIGQGFLGGIGERLGTNSPTQQDYRSTIASVRTVVKNALLGANMSASEQASLSAFIPEFGDAPAIAKQKLATFIREAQRMSRANVTPQYQTTIQQ